MQAEAEKRSKSIADDSEGGTILNRSAAGDINSRIFAPDKMKLYLD
jgi:hypothetical protein